MNKIQITLALTLFISNLFLFQSCKKEDKLEPLIDTTARGTIVRADLVHNWTRAQADSFVRSRNSLAANVYPAQYDLKIYKVIYNTIDPFGNKTTASGALIIPQSANKLAMCGYMHGTVMERSGVPSNKSDEFVIGMIQGGTGYITFLPDYLGLGESTFPWHPYVHAKSEATCAIDLYRASKKIMSENNIQHNGQFFVFGYSQGGHASMAMHKEIEEHYANEIPISGSANMSGPYDISGYQADIITAEKTYPAPYYLPYVLFSYNKIYNVYPNVTDFMKEPYATQLPPMYDTYHSAGEVDAIMPDTIKRILLDTIIYQFDYDPNNKFRKVLRENDLYDWNPKADMLITYCRGDNHVVYQNALVAYYSFIAKGKTNISIQNLGDNLDHGDCVLPTLLSAKNWIDSRRTN